MMKTTMMMRRKGIHNKAGLRRFLIFLWIPTMTRVRTMTLMTRMIMLEISITGWPPSIAPVVTETINKTINKIAVIMTPTRELCLQVIISNPFCQALSLSNQC